MIPVVSAPPVVSSIFLLLHRCYGVRVGAGFGEGRDDGGVGAVGRPYVVRLFENPFVGGFREVFVCNGIADHGR